MHEPDRVIGEHTLAAFLAGTLPAERRQEVIEYLAGNPDAREVLHMAAGALEAARAGETIESGPDVRDPALFDDPRRPQPRRMARWTRGAGRYVAATLFVFAVGIILRLSLGPPTDALRSPLDRSETAIQVEVEAPGPTIEWEPVDDAYRYRLVVWDPSEARVAGEYETSDSDLGADHPVVLQFPGDLRAGQRYALRVDAIDAQNRIVRSSEAVDFVYE